MIKQPLTAPACLFAGGIVLAHVAPWDVPWLFAATLLAGLSALWRAEASPWLLPVFLVLAGAFHFTVSTAALDPMDLRVRATTPALATLEGELAATPEERRHERNGVWRTNTLAVLRCTRLRASEDDALWRDARGLVLVSTPSTLPEQFGRGRRVRINGVLDQPRGAQAPGLFDYARHLALRGIHHELRTSEPADWSALESATGTAWTPPWDERFQHWARATLAHDLPHEDAALRLLWSMTLGWKTGLTDDVEEPFMRTGTMHLFAISGLHIAFLAAVVAHALRLLRFPRVAIALLVFPIAWAYTAATGWQPSAVRATIMTSVIVGSWLLARPPELLNSLSAAALGVLIWDPRQLFQAGFQLSFAVVAAIALLQPPFTRWLARWTAPDPLVPTELVPRWRRVLHLGWGKVATALAVSAAAWIGSLPLAAHYFHLITPSSLVANLVLVPLSSAALASNFGALVCGDVLPWLTGLFNHGAWFWMRGMMRFSEHAATWPGGCFHVARWPLGLTALWYVALAATGLRRRPSRRLGVALATAGVLGVSAAALEWRAQRADLRLTILPLRGGHAVWFEGSHTGSGLIDTGDALSAEYVTAPFLRARGVDEIPLVVLTHGDTRHTGGVEFLTQRFRMPNVWQGPVAFRSTPYRRTIQALATNRATILHTAQAPGEIAPFRVWHPRAMDRYSRADDACLVLELVRQGRRILLAGDLGTAGQQALLERHADLRADLVVAGLHDRGGTLSPSVLERLGTRLLIVADDRLPAMARTKEAVRRSLRSVKAEVWFTSDTGALELRWRDGNLEIRDATGRLLDRRRWDRSGSVAHEAGIVSGDEVEDGHAHGETVGHLLEDH